jgi:hypothetical protein
LNFQEQALSWKAFFLQDEQSDMNGSYMKNDKLPAVNAGQAGVNLVYCIL